MEDAVVASIASALPASLADHGPASASRDNALVDIYNTLTDESGHSSDDDKLAAWKKLQDLSQVRNAQQPYGFAGYSTADIQLLNKINPDTSSFVRKLNDLAKKQEQFGIQLVQSGKSGSAGVQAQIDFFDSLSPLEQGVVTSERPDYRDILAGLKKTFQVLESRIAAGAFQWGAPVDQVTDAQSRTALLLIDRLQAPDAAIRKQARGTADALGQPRDTVSLSDLARRYLDRRQAGGV